MTFVRWGVLALAVLLEISCVVSGSILDGANECPCFSAGNAPDFLLAGVQDGGFPAGYGLGGCKAHDEGVNQTGCDGSGALPTYCAAHWCYVDPAVCQMDREECLRLGLQLDDPSHPACRSRPMSASSFFPGAFYSYQTCGYLNTYDSAKFDKMVQGRTLVGATKSDLPFVLVSQLSGEADGANVEKLFSGSAYDFLVASLKLFSSPPELRLSSDWATEESEARFASDYTACVNDVAVGNYDICLGDFWVTAERMQMTTFLPPYRTDNFYLVVFEHGVGFTFWELLQNPFMPFSNGTWALIFGVIFFMALTMAILDFGEDDAVEQQSYLNRALQSFFLAWVSIFSGKSNFRAASLPAQISTMGFQIFLLIMVASYKANLASMLIARSMVGGVDTMEAAIDRGLTICIPVAINGTMHQLFPNANFLPFPGTSANFARRMHSGACAASVIHHKRLADLHSGWIQRSDCEAVASGAATEEEARCSSGRHGAPRDDCGIVRVGETILSIPLAFPIRADWELVQALSWAITQARNSGQWEMAVQANRHLSPEPQCSAGFEAGDRLGEEYFAGGSWIVALAVALGLGIRVVEKRVLQRGRAESETESGAEGEGLSGGGGEPKGTPHSRHGGHHGVQPLAAGPGTHEGLWQGVDQQRVRRLSLLHREAAEHGVERDRAILERLEELTLLTKEIRERQGADAQGGGKAVAQLGSVQDEVRVQPH